MRLPSTKFLQRLATTLVLGLLLITTLAVFMIIQMQKEEEPKTVSGFIPAQALAIVQAPAGATPDINMLPDLPKALAPEHVIPGWRYFVEEAPLQQVRVGIRNGETTLCFSHVQFLRLEVMAPIIALEKSTITAVRARGRIRRSDDFNGTVLFTVTMLAQKEDGTYESLATAPFEVRNSRGEPAGALSLNRKIPLAKRTTHIRFSIVTTFKGTLEIEQPVLTGEHDD